MKERRTRTGDDEARRLFELKLQMLESEMQMIQSTISKFDDMLFKIKGFAVTVCVGLLGFAIKEKSPLLALLALCASVFFWLSEATFKKYQRGYIYRMNKIVRFLHSDDFDRSVKERDLGGFKLPDPNNHYFASEKEKRKTGYLRSAFLPNVWVFYVALIMVSIIVSIALT